MHELPCNFFCFVACDEHQHDFVASFAIFWHFGWTRLSGSMGNVMTGRNAISDSLFSKKLQETAEACKKRREMRHSMNKACKFHCTKKSQQGVLQQNVSVETQAHTKHANSTTRVKVLHALISLFFHAILRMSFAVQATCKQSDHKESNRAMTKSIADNDAVLNLSSHFEIISNLCR